MKTAAILRRAGHEVVPAPPDTGVNTVTGEGLKEALAGTQGVIHPANSFSLEAQAVLDTSELGDGHLAEPPWIEQDALPVDGEAAIHLASECALVQRGLVQG
jgi:hypothetical protein